MKTRVIQIAVFLIAVTGFVFGSDFIGTPAQAAGASDAAQFARGAQAWANTCAGCHNMRAPNELRDDQWRAVVTHMRVRSGISGAQARDILAFLEASN